MDQAEIFERIDVLTYKAYEDPKHMGLYSELIYEWKHILGIGADMVSEEFCIYNKAE